MSDEKPTRKRTDRTPARRKPDAPAVVALPDGQAALFLDPAELLSLPDPDLAQLAHAWAKSTGGMLAQIRRGSGLLAWAYWHRLDEARYGQWMTDYASLVGITDQTLRGWRDAVVKGESLALPAVAQLRRGEATRRESDKRAGQPGGVVKNTTGSARLTSVEPESLPLAPPEPPVAPAPRLTPPIPDSIAAFDTDTPQPPSPAVLEVRNLIGRVTSTSANSLATCCTSDALRQARERINEALREQEMTRRTQTGMDTSSPGCTHPKDKLKQLGYATFCDVSKGGCGAKVR